MVNARNCFEDKNHKGDWRVESILEDGAIEVVLFSGPNAERRSHQYFHVLNAVYPTGE